MAAQPGSIRISIQCVDDVHGCPGVVVYGNETFIMPSNQVAQPLGIALDDEHGPVSSVQVFQVACTSPQEEVDDRGLKVKITIQWMQGGLSGSQNPAPGPGRQENTMSNVAPPNACDDEEPMEIN